MVRKISLVVLASFYVVAGVNHFRVPGFYEGIMPSYLPWHGALVAVSGVAEIVLGLGVLVPATRKLACWGIVVMLAAFLPVHVHMLVNAHLYPDVPVAALWLRFPVQALFALWAWWHSKES